MTVERDHVFTEPGTHFSSHPNGDPTTPYARMDNLAQARVVVG